jgi:hypothetical protein
MVWQEAATATLSADWFGSKNLDCFQQLLHRLREVIL